VLDVVETIRITKEAQALGEAKIDLITALGGRDSIVLDVVGDLLLEDTAVVTSLDTESLAVRSPQSFNCHHYRETGCLTRNATYLGTIPAISLRTRTFACGPQETGKRGYSTPASRENG